jgi:hypothetical protein
MSNLLKSAQAIFNLNSQWNKVIGLIKEISIKRYSQSEFRSLIDEIVKEEFSDERSSEH